MPTVEQVYTAIREGDIDIVEEYLTELDNITNEKLKKVNTFLHFAIREGQLDIIKLIVSHKGTPEGYNRWALKTAQMYNASNEIINYLLDGEKNNDTCD